MRKCKWYIHSALVCYVLELSQINNKTNSFKLVLLPLSVSHLNTISSQTLRERNGKRFVIANENYTIYGLVPAWSEHWADRLIRCHYIGRMYVWVNWKWSISGMLTRMKLTYTAYQHQTEVEKSLTQRPTFISKHVRKTNKQSPIVLSEYSREQSWSPEQNRMYALRFDWLVFFNKFDWLRTKRDNNDWDVKPPLITSSGLFIL